MNLLDEIQEAPAAPDTYLGFVYEQLGLLSASLLIVAVLLCASLTISGWRNELLISANLRWIYSIAIFTTGWILYQTSTDIISGFSHIDTPDPRLTELVTIGQEMVCIQALGVFLISVFACTIILNVQKTWIIKRP